MKISKRGNKFRIMYRCPNFDRVIVESFDSEKEAQLRASQVELEKEQGTLIPPVHLIDLDDDQRIVRKIITVEQLMTEFVKLYGLNHWSEGTLSCNQHRIEDYIIPYIGNLPIKSLTAHRLEKYYKMLQTQPSKQRKGHTQASTISPSVIEKVHSLISTALNQAIRWDYLQGANRALTLCEDPILSTCLYLAIGCSMRIGEILGLTWDCVHIEPELVETGEAYLFVEKELRRGNKKNWGKLRANGRDEVFLTFPELKENCSTVLVLKTPKTESSVRSIYIPRTVAEKLQEMRFMQESRKDFDNTGEYQDYNLVIAQENGRPIEERRIARWFRAFIEENDLPPVVFHSLRHTSTSMKLRISGGDIKAVQGDTGHAQSNMVTDVYSHIMTDDRKRLARKLDAEFFAATKTSANSSINTTVSAPISEHEKTAAEPTTDNAVNQLMQLLNGSPEIAESLLLLSKALSQNAN